MGQVIRDLVVRTAEPGKRFRPWSSQRLDRTQRWMARTLGSSAVQRPICRSEASSSP